jgi:hypothetical protein
MQIWNGGKVLRFCIVLQWLFGLSTSIPIFAQFDGFSYTIAPDNKSITFTWEHGSNFSFIVQLLQYTPMAAIVVLLYSIIFASTMKKKVRHFFFVH